MILILMGVMGTGKTTIAQLLVKRTGWVYAEGDDFHPEANVKKMHAGIPLTDEDRAPWLASLHAQIAEWDEGGENAVLTCSALKQAYRGVLLGNLPHARVRFVYLEGARETLEKHLASRKGHFMNPALLDSQLAILEVPKDAINVSVEHSPEDAVQQILDALPPGLVR
jgi:gluconokinase